MKRRRRRKLRVANATKKSKQKIDHWIGNDKANGDLEKSTGRNG